MQALLQTLAQSAAADWIDIRYHRRVVRTAAVRKGQLTTSASSVVAGVGIRVLAGGGWGFAATADLSEASLRRALDSAVRGARALGAVRRTALTVTPGPLGPAPFTAAAAPARPDFEEMLQQVLATEARVRAASSRISSGAVSYSELDDERLLCNSAGQVFAFRELRPEFRVQAVAEHDGELQTANNNVGVKGSIADLFADAAPEILAERSAKQAVDLLSAPYPDGGRATVILAPEVVGLLAHEAIGHTVEADFVLAGSIAAGKIGTKVASSLVNLVDSGLVEHGRAPAGALPVDDEGVTAGRTQVIKNGELVSYLHNRETAARFGVAPTGNARAFEYNDEPLIRMRNTFIEPGTTPLDEMIAGVKQGYLLQGMGGGQADANAEFVFGVQRAIEIKDGKLGRLLRGVTISGQAFDVLNSVDAVGSDFAWGIGAGYCGKKQRCKVDGGGPHLRCVVTLGGSQKEIASGTAMG